QRPPADPGPHRLRGVLRRQRRRRRLSRGAGDVRAQGCLLMATPVSSAPAPTAGTGPALLDAEDRNRRRAEWRTIWTIAAVVAATSFVFGWSISDNRDAADRWLSGLQGIVNSLMVSVP